MQVNIDFAREISRMQRHYATLAPAKFNAATARALTRTASAARTQASLKIRKAYRIPARFIGRSLSLRKSSARTLEAQVWAEGKPLPMVAFGARQTKAGVSINVKGTRKLVKGAFLATMRSGHKGVFARVQRGKFYVGGDLKGRHGAGSRLRASGTDAPIGELRTVGVPKAFSNSVVIDALKDKSREHFPGELAHQLAWYAGEIPH